MSVQAWPATLSWLDPDAGECGWNDCDRPAALGRYLCEPCIAELEARAARIVAKITRQVLGEHQSQCEVCGKPGAQAITSTIRGDRPIHEACRGIQAQPSELRGGQGGAPRAARRDGTGPLRRAPTPASP